LGGNSRLRSRASGGDALALFRVLVEPKSRKAVSVAPGAMYGFCTTPIPVEKWERYAARYKRYLNNKGPEPECP
jgi:hypothetical protein